MASREYAFRVVPAVKIASVWVVALLSGWLLRAIIPPTWGVFRMDHIYHVNRIAFWICLISAAVVTLVWVLRLCMQGLRA